MNYCLKKSHCPEEGDTIVWKKFDIARSLMFLIALLRLHPINASLLFSVNTIFLSFDTEDTSAAIFVQTLTQSTLVSKVDDSRERGMQKMIKDAE